MTTIQERFFEIDQMRGLAVIMMVLYHVLFDVYFFNIYPVDVTSGFWKIFAMVTASLFLLLVGVSFTISAARAEVAMDGRSLFLKFLKRGIFILLIAALITVVTWWYLGEGYIIFGILHLIGISIIIAPFFFHRRLLSLFGGIVFIVVGILLQAVRGPSLLLPLGVHPVSFYSVDYTPIFPWFGLVLIGIFLGELLYPGGKRGYSLPEFTQYGKLQEFPGTAFAFLGRHSLAIYILHQPVLILLLHPPWG
ncbi:MAG: heparan-alpha-glucosaminide N-acetyltransferase [Methanomicrobiales archaeon]|nr:heparan-alpha-glucosaminide N-acetyltransferase [Methanomicrobiales archaeon]